LLERINSSFIVIGCTKHIFIGIDSTGFKKDNSCFTMVLYRTNRIEERRKYAKLCIGADVLQQIICNIRIRRAPTRHDNVDFRPIITRTSDILPLSVVAADKGYDSEDNHLLVSEELHALSMILSVCESNLTQF
jgi:hypothetical protein